MKLGYIIILIAGLLLAACSSSTSSKSTADKPNFSQACEQSGGKWTRGGIGGFYGCLKRAPDAGKVCSDDSECTYNCYASKADERRTGQPGLGQCQADNRYQGCNSEVRKGIIQPRYCVKI